MAFFADRLERGGQREAPKEGSIFMDVREGEDGTSTLMVFVPADRAKEVVEGPATPMTFKVNGKDVEYVQVSAEGVEREHISAVGRAIGEKLGVDVELLRARLADGSVNINPSASGIDRSANNPNTR